MINDYLRKSLTIVILAIKEIFFFCSQVKPIDLGTSFSLQSSFKIINFTIRSNFNSIDPTTTICLLPRRKRN